MNLKPQDILFLLKLVALGRKTWSFNRLAIELGMSASEVHAAAKRALAARLVVKEGENFRLNLQNLEDFLLHGLQYVFVPERGELSLGMPTAYAAAPLDSYFVAENIGPPPVWPDPEGEVRGESFSPLYKSASVAAKNDPALYKKENRPEQSYSVKQGNKGRELNELVKNLANTRSGRGIDGYNWHR